jgi:hypothetical protein
VAGWEGGADGLAEVRLLPTLVDPGSWLTDRKRRAATDVEAGRLPGHGLERGSIGLTQESYRSGVAREDYFNDRLCPRYQP